MTGKAFLQDDVIVNTNSRFISNIFEQLTSIVYVCLQWMASLLLYCLPFAAACCLLRLTWDNRIAIFYKLRMFISIISEELTNIRFWENICVILENLCWFFSPMFEALKNLAYYCLEWITSYCTTVSFYLRKLILEMVAIFKAMMFAVFTNIRYWVNTCAIREYFSIVLRRIVLIYLPASFCLAASCYFIKSMSEVVVAKLQEMMAAMLDNLRIFTAMMYEVLTNIKYWGISGAISLIAWTIITHRFRDWIYFLASYCFTVLRFALGWILTVVAGVRDSGGKIVVANLHKLPLLILKIRDALARITHRILKWITEYMYENDHSEIQEGGQPKDGKTLTAPFHRQGFLSTPPSPILRITPPPPPPPSTTRIGYREENGNDRSTYDKDHCETQE